MSKGLVLLVVALVLSGCAIARSPLTGFIYTDMRDGVTATSNQAGNRVGEACGTSILGWVATGDSSIEAARRAGGITMVSSVDNYASSILGVYAKYCTIVRGR